MLINRGVLRLSKNRCYSTVPTQATVARFTKNGNARAVIKLETEPLPAPTDNEVTIKMLYAPINHGDLNAIEGTLKGKSSPSVGGSEGVAKVVAVGKGVKSAKVGDLVLPYLGKQVGTWRTHATLNQSDVAVVPSDVKPEYLATLVAPATALRILKDFAQLKAGDVIIQNAANGMVGLSVVQIAAAMGLKSINIIRQRSDYNELVERIKAYGGYVAVSDDYVRTPEFRSLIADLPKPKLALNAVGGRSATEMARLLSKGGTLVTYGAMSSQPVTIPASSLLFNDINVRGFLLSDWVENHKNEDALSTLKEVIQLIQQNKLRLWTETHAFNNIDTALQRAVDTYTRDRKVLLSFE